jgi:Mce-associated membrane protein
MTIESIVFRAILLAAALTTAATGLAVRAAATGPADGQTAVCDFGREVATYDDNDVDGYFQRVLDRTTGGFHDNFLNAAPTLRAELVGTHAHSDGAVVECTATPTDDNHQTGRLVVDQTISTDDTQRQPRTSRFTFTVILDRVDDGWLVSDLQSAD